MGDQCFWISESGVEPCTAAFHAIWRAVEGEICDRVVKRKNGKEKGGGGLESEVDSGAFTVIMH